jgi:hypothetical protein
LAPTAYTYVGQDKVGPALYNPNPDSQKPVAPQINFVASKTKRTLFEPVNKRENELPPKEIPGPGKYDPSLPTHYKTYNSTGNASIFLSKVPNCKDAKIKNSVPGPGNYD